mgnify:CR=1 FL=1
MGDSDPAQTRAANERAMAAFMEAIGGPDYAALREICHPDIVVELPYNDPPVRLEGIDAYCQAIEPSLELFQFKLLPEKIHPGLDPDLLIVEYTSDGIAVPTGKTYRNVYIGLFRFEAGRLLFLREFFNPEIAAQALTPD